MYVVFCCIFVPITNYSKGMFKRFRKRFYVRMSRLGKKMTMSSSENKLDDIQMVMASTIRKMMSKPDSTLLIAPISDICYIEWKHYFIRFGDNSATITNGKFSYYIWLPSDTMLKIKKIFYQHVETRRQMMESQYDKKTLENLKSISNELNNLPV